MRMRGLAILSAAVMMASAPLLAHHSAAMFDRSRKVTVKGTVVRFQYVQPHSWIDVMVVDESGKETLWAFEGGAPMQMKMVGLTPDVLKVGDKITITGYPLRDGRTAASFVEAVLPNGKTYNTKPAGNPGGPVAPAPGAAQPPASATPPAPSAPPGASTSPRMPSTQVLAHTPAN